MKALIVLLLLATTAVAGGNEYKVIVDKESHTMIVYNSAPPVDLPALGDSFYSITEDYFSRYNGKDWIVYFPIGLRRGDE